MREGECTLKPKSFYMANFEKKIKIHIKNKLLNVGIG